MKRTVYTETVTNKTVKRILTNYFEMWNKNKVFTRKNVRTNIKHVICCCIDIIKQVSPITTGFGSRQTIVILQLKRRK